MREAKNTEVQKSHEKLRIGQIDNILVRCNQKKKKNACGDSSEEQTNN